ncbi:MAG: DUF4369 domain-containing protein [Lutibacter sp.]|uniref:DUF4369 domain-containing protein n=1 Tax=Lutibacter sp. TaxID=1925666 RepID=UPI0017B75500|nr:DUF4369 domain-containing protein [Lutibacter sp.]MBT8316152.1 DUF4369 domain-containing protein [Lutibacter sp.]NNJ57012.1 DUF4369 domain-containing protein [Lutibacter sp.]
MKKVVLVFLLGFLLFSCKKEPSQNGKQTGERIITNKTFILEGYIENFNPNKVYLNKIIENSIYPIDSSEVVDNTFKLSGIVEKPERFALTFENYAAITIFIIENKSFTISINSETINDPFIKGSELNSQLITYKEKSKEIFKQIDYLFPQFQKARLENDAPQLNKIRDEMKKIEMEHLNFSYKYIAQNKESYVAAMILRDQLKADTIDTLRIKEAYNILSIEVKTAPDAEIIASFLNLH